MIRMDLKLKKISAVLFMGPIIAKLEGKDKILNIKKWINIGTLNFGIFLVGMLLLMISLFDSKLVSLANIFFVINLIISLFGILSVFYERNRFLSKILSLLGVSILFIFLFIQPTSAQISQQNTYSGKLVDLTITHIDLGNDLNYIVDRTYPFFKIGLTSLGTTGANIYRNGLIINCKDNKSRPILTYTNINTLKINPYQTIYISVYSQEKFFREYAINGEVSVTCEIDSGNNIEGYIDSSGNFVKEPNLYLNNSKTQKFKLILPNSLGRFDETLEKSTKSIQYHLDTPPVGTGTKALTDFIIHFFLKILFPILVVLAILVAIFGFYEMFFSKSDDGFSKGSKYLAGGVVSIVLIMSAKFITNVIYNGVFKAGKMTTFNALDILNTLYSTLIFPFLKVIIYLTLGFLFIMVLISVFNFFWGGGEAPKKAKNILLFNTLGILLIISAKQLVEAIYGKKEEILRQATNLGDIGAGILAHKSIPILYQILNRVGGLTVFVILVIIIFEAFKLLTNPSDEQQIGKILKKIGYIFVGILVVGVAYILVNALIIK